MFAEGLLGVREDDRQIFKASAFLPGGFSGGKTIRDTYSYLPRLRRWIGNSAMAFTRCEHGMATVRDRIFCIGGRTLKGVSSFALLTPNLTQNGVSVLLGPDRFTHHADQQLHYFWSLSGWAQL